MESEIPKIKKKDYDKEYTIDYKKCYDFHHIFSLIRLCMV